MKKTSTIILTLALAGAITAVHAKGNPHWAQTTTDTDAVTTTTAGSLTSTEVQDLTYLREEEKLARDTYITLHSLWGLEIFDKISQSEQTHMDAVKDLLDKYGLDDPALPVIGAFSNPDLQAAYDQLIERGSASPIEALMVGGYIEELDIKDLEIKLGETDKPDIETVYAHLERGSRDHLRSFVGQIESRDLVYTAQILDQATVDSIVGTAIETGP